MAEYKKCCLQYYFDIQSLPVNDRESDIHLSFKINLKSCVHHCFTFTFYYDLLFSAVIMLNKNVQCIKHSTETMQHSEVVRIIHSTLMIKLMIKLLAFVSLISSAFHPICILLALHDPRVCVKKTIFIYSRKQQN